MHRSLPIHSLASLACLNQAVSQGGTQSSRQTGRPDYRNKLVSQAGWAVGIKRSSRAAGRQTGLQESGNQSGRLGNRNQAVIQAGRLDYRNKLVSKAGWAVGIKQSFRLADRHTGRQAD